MADCYPQGCNSCEEGSEIKFPENPTNGQRKCFPIGKDPNTGEDILKCWVYDHCVPGWRAEGPAESPINFKGGVDLTKTEAGNGITTKEAGDYYVVAVASNDQPFLDANWSALQHVVEVGSFIMWSGSEWVEIPRPCGNGGSGVQSDWLETDENSASFIKNKPQLPEGIGNIDGGSIVITLASIAPQYCSGALLTLNATAEPTSADGKPVVGFFEYTWESSNDGSSWTPFGLLQRTTESSYQTTSEKVVENYTGDPSQFRLSVKFTDFFGNEATAVSGVITPVAAATYTITQNPGNADLSVNTNATFTVAGSGATVEQYKWYVAGTPITKADAIPGYTMANWDTATLSVTRTAGDAGSTAVYVDVYNDSQCTPVVRSSSGQLIGPSGDSPDPNPGAGSCCPFGAVGYRTSFSGGNTTGIYWRPDGSGPWTYGPSLDEEVYLISATNTPPGYPAIAIGNLDGNGQRLDGHGPAPNLPTEALQGKWKVETLTVSNTPGNNSRSGTVIRIE